MALVRIFSTTGIEIEYKQDSLTLKKENNSLSSDFKVPHSSFPFLVIENDVTKSVLGPSDITSIRKNKIVPVIILENGVRYYGELQQLTVLSKFRKCNLKYGSDIIPVFNKKIADFMPVVSVIPDETDPVPFSETSPEIIAGYENWETYPVDFIGEIYPDVKWQFPTMYWRNKFGVGLESTDTYYNYKNEINAFFIDESGLFTFKNNTVEITETEVITDNNNVASPQVFLLSPLYYIINSIGFKMSGNFLENDFIKKLLLLSTKTNNTEITLYALSESVIFDGTWSNAAIQFPYTTKRIKEIFSGLVPGTYTIFYHVKLSEQVAAPSTSTIRNSLRASVVLLPFGTTVDVQVGFNSNLNPENQILEGEFDIEIPITSLDLDYELHISYYNADEELPIEYEITFRKKDTEKVFSQLHPTIKLGRYVPDWTVGNYLNYLKNQFNLDITIDDFKKEIQLNLEEDSFFNENVAVISQSLAMKSYDIAANSSFVLKYENDEDPALFITQEEVVAWTGSEDDFTKTIQSKFKFVPSNGYTSELSEELEDKEGIGLMIYDPENAPYTSVTTSDGFHLNIPGEKGIYETFFKRTLRIFLNGSDCEVTGNFTETEVLKMNKLKSAYINNQRFKIISIETTEASNNFKEVKMKLLSVNY